MIQKLLKQKLIKFVALDNEGLHNKEYLLVELVAIQWTTFQKNIYIKGYIQCIDCCVSNIIKSVAF